MGRPSRSDRVRVRDLLRGLAILGLLLAEGCGVESPFEEGRIPVVTTTGMITDLVERVGGERVSVRGLMGPGIDPHLYKASAGDVRLLSAARVVFYNGLHLEAAMAEVLREMDGRTRTRAVTDGIPRDRLLASPTYPDQFDPHVWFDVGLWRETVAIVAETLAEVDPEGADAYRANAATFASELEALDGWVRDRVATLAAERRVLVTAHDAFHYFGRAYGFEVEGLQGISTVAEAGTGDVQRLVGTIVDRRIPAIFVESSIPRRNVEAVQAAVRARGFEVAIGGLLYSDAMGDPESEAGTYPGMVHHNVNTIVEALRGEGGEGDE